VPAHQAERYLAEALRSILDQTRPADEVIVVDDGCTDGTAAVAREFDRVTLLSLRHAGIGATMNAGLLAARGEYVGFLDADDLWSRDKLERQMEAFVRRPETDLVFGGVQSFISAEIDEAERGRIECPAAPMAGFVAGTLLARRDVFARVGLFRTDVRVGQFVDWCARARESGAITTMLPEVVLRRRLHGRNLSLREPDARRDFVRLAKAALDRRRARA
jgi:glycosyltransferase involved in cell wall biosynthesis